MTPKQLNKIGRAVNRALNTARQAERELQDAVVVSSDQIDARTRLDEACRALHGALACLDSLAATFRSFGRM